MNQGAGKLDKDDPKNRFSRVFPLASRIPFRQAIVKIRLPTAPLPPSKGLRLPFPFPSRDGLRRASILSLPATASPSDRSRAFFFFENLQKTIA
jgi:hypothetical protein